MKLIYFFLAITLFSIQNSWAQNIPHANTTGPYGVQVNTYNGNLHFQRMDLVIPNTGLSIDLSFAYNSFQDTIQNGYGKGFTFTYNMYYELDSTGVNYYVQRPDGRRDLFEFSNGIYIAPKGIFDTWQQYEPGKFLLTTKYGLKYYFDDPGHQKLTKITDPNNNTIELTYDGNGHPIQIQDQSQRFVILNWTNDLLQHIQDNNFSEARQILFDYNVEGQLIKATDPMGGEMQYSYDSVFLIQMLNERNDYLDINYDELGRVKELISCVSTLKLQYSTEQNRTYAIEENDSGNRMTTFVYDETGKLQSKVGSCCGFNTQYGYDDDINTNQLTDANGNQYTANNDESGNALLTTDPQSNTQGFQFGNLNRLTAYTDKNGNASTFSYDGAGNLLAVNQPMNITLNFGYDDVGNMTNLTDGNNNLTSLEYNGNNDVVEIIYPITEIVENFEYDNAGNMTKNTDGNDNSVNYEYDKLNRLTKVWDDLGNEVNFSFDAASNLTSETDANNNLKEFGYDPSHRLERVKTPAGETFYKYDASDNLIAIIDANGHESSFKYNVRNLLIEETDAEGNTTFYDYDGNGNVISKQDANGDLTAYRYDALNRLIEKSYKGNTDTYNYDANGNLVYCANNGIAFNYTYDALNRITSKTVLNWNQTIEYEYDNAGNRTLMKDETGETIYTYDQNNRLTSITNPKGEVTAFVYDLGSRLIEQHQHNNTITYYIYDAANRLLSLENKRTDGSIISGYAYEYDGNGNRTKITENDGTIWAYTYDGDNRLISSQKNGIDIQEYQFDSVGNRLQLNEINYVYDDADRIQSVENGASYQFDKNGNLTQKTFNNEITNYQYDGENRLIKVIQPDGTTINFQYDPFGNRIAKTIGNELTRYVLDGDNVLLELDNANAIKARYTAGLAMDSWISMERGEDSYFYHTDGLGSIKNLTNTNAIVENTYEYDDYGNVTQSGNIENPYTYTGREWEAAIGLYYYRTRFYDAEVGRFLTKDVEFGNIRRPSSFNRYNYVEGNPINYVDPTGEEFATAIITVGLAIITIVDVVYQLIANYIEFGWKVQCWEFGLLEIMFKGVLKAIRTLNVAPLLEDINMFERGTKQAQKQYMESIFKKGGYDTKLITRIKKLQSTTEKLKINKDNLVKHGKINSLITEATLKIGKMWDWAFSKFSLVDCREEGGEQKEEKIPPPPTLPPIGDDNQICIPIIRSVDPNEIIAPIGHEIQKWVAKTATLPYTILFENDPEFATAAAQRVEIFHKFDEDINRFSFRLGDFGFGSYYFSVPEDVSYYNTQIDLTDSLGILLQVTAGLNAADSSAFWIFESKDPATGLASTLPANLGFLPVNDTLTHVGEGFVNFTVRPSNNSITGDVIEAQASIFFDDNAPIETNVDFNTIDADAPESSIHTDDENNGIHHLQWSGTDVINGISGAGLASYSIYVSTNDGPFLPVENNLTDTTYVFNGSIDSSYCFFVRARDFVGNKEPLKLNCEPTCMQVNVVEIVHASGGMANGSIELDVVGNGGSLTYQWSHNSELNSNIATDLAAGNYSVTIGDTSGCIIFSTFTIEQINQVFEKESQPLFIHKMYPVPTQSELIVEFSSDALVVFVEVYDMLGKRFFQQTITTTTDSVQQLNFNVSDYPAGNYLIRIRDRKQQVSGIFIKQ